MRASDEDIKNHRKIKLTEINVLRSEELTADKCMDEIAIRQFCGRKVSNTSTGFKTLPDMIEIELYEYGEDETTLQWQIVVWENPNVAEVSS